MSYDYQIERPNLFTENGQLRFITVRDKIREAQFRVFTPQRTNP